MSKTLINSSSQYGIGSVLRLDRSSLPADQGKQHCGY